MMIACARAATVLVLLLAALVVPRSAGAVAAGWSLPDYLSTDERTGLAPSLGILADGTPVAAWAEQTLDGWFPVMASRPIMGEWSSPYAIADDPIDAPGIYSFGPRVGVASNGQLVAAWLVHRDQPKGDGTFVHQAVVEGATGTIGAGGARDTPRTSSPAATRPTASPTAIRPASSSRRRATASSTIRTTTAAAARSSG